MSKWLILNHFEPWPNESLNEKRWSESTQSLSVKTVCSPTTRISWPSSMNPSILKHLCSPSQGQISPIKGWKMSVVGGHGGTFNFPGFYQNPAPADWKRGIAWIAQLQYFSPYWIEIDAITTPSTPWEMLVSTRDPTCSPIFVDQSTLTQMEHGSTCPHLEIVRSHQFRRSSYTGPTMLELSCQKHLHLTQLQNGPSLAEDVPRV